MFKSILRHRGDKWNHICNLSGILLWVSLLASPAAIACIQSVDSQPTYVEVCSGGACKHIDYVDVRGGTPSGAELESILDSIQAWLDVRIPIISLETDDPDKACNLADQRDSLFCGDIDGNRQIPTKEEDRYLIGRSCEVSAEWDGVDRYRYSFTRQ